MWKYIQLALCGCVLAALLNLLAIILSCALGYSVYVILSAESKGCLTVTAFLVYTPFPPFH